MTAAIEADAGVDDVDVVVIGAGVSGLGFANAIRAEVAALGRPAPSVVVLEADAAPGGYCKTVVQDGFVWDYSGHFFHFKRPDIEAWLRARMPGQEVRTVVKRSLIRYGGADVDFPFQTHLHQLPKAELIECLVDLFARPEGGAPRSFQDMLYRKFGRGIAEKFLVPYNAKLYATDLDTLDVDAMGRFFPHADLPAIVANMRPKVAGADDGSYNATFTYPVGGAIQYIHALLADLPGDAVALGEPAVALDLRARTVTTPRRTLRFRQLVSSAPLPALARAAGLPHDGAAFTSNRVLVFNLGFDRKGPTGVHWMYFPDPARCFYRVGWYDNILDGPRMSLYVEVGLPPARPGDAAIDVAGIRARVLADLAAEGIITDHRLVSEHHVVLDPAYAHITRASLAETARLKAIMAAAGVHPVGRYGGWTYCSIEDNLIEVRALARTLAPVL
jgi:protoporphyrinogen oxidase